MREEDEREAGQCNQVRCYPCWQLLDNGITHWALEVCIVQTVALTVVLPADDIMLVFGLDVRSAALEEIPDESCHEIGVLCNDGIC